MRRIEEMNDITTQEDELFYISKPFKAKFISFLNKDITPTIYPDIHKENLGQQNIFCSFEMNQKNHENNHSQYSYERKQEKQINRACFTMINNNLLEGQGNMHYHNGTNFKGFYGNKNRVKGHFKFKNGFQYLGECHQNSFSGQGTLIFPSGKIISGNWNNYQIVGKGKIEYPNGQAYYGEIKDFKKHGNGQFFFNDGSKYIGDFYCGLINGYGSYLVDDQEVCKGIWVNGQLEQSEQPNQSGQTKDEWLKLTKLSTVYQQRQSTHHLISSVKVEEDF